MSDTTAKNRQWLLAKRPVGHVQESDFELHEAPRPAPADGQVLVRNRGRIAWEVDVQHGFENAPKTLLRLYSGANFGKQLLEI